ncbi:MAG: nitroreductase family deazaflavin-dependent oxidoreductase [Actinomycetota bacterium]
MGGSLTPDRTDALGALDYCYLTTVGRVSGNAHEIEIWFALHDGILYLLSGGRDGSDWVKNLRANADVTVRLGAETRVARARMVARSDEDELARSLLVEKYRPRYSGELDDWGRTSLPVAVEWALGQLV